MDIIRDMAENQNRIGIYVVPTGVGKSLCYLSTAIMSRERSIILTSTKGLQDQLEREFGNLISVVKGKANFPCPISWKGYNCDRGPCNWGYDCSLYRTTCPYYAQIRKGAESSIVVTNYAFWMSNDTQSLGKFNLLIMDEAHDAGEQLLSHVSMTIKREDVTRYIEWTTHTSPSAIMEWLRILKGRLEDRVRKSLAAGRMDDMKPLAILRDLDKLAYIKPYNLILDNRGNSIHADAISPADLAEPLLLRRVPRVIMTSATVSSREATFLGVGSVKDGDVTIREYPSIFEKHRRRVIHIPCVKVDHRMTTAHLNQWVGVIDNIIAKRMMEKGIIHAVSYNRCDHIKNMSCYGGIMTTHRGLNTQEVVEEFKRSKAPSILVSPAVGTGYDFPDEDCRWQIVAKLQFPDGRPLIMKARAKNDPEYAVNQCIQSLVQASGRGVRTPTDHADTFVVDNHIQWLVGRYRHLFPRWWLESLFTSSTIPDAIDYGK